MGFLGLFSSVEEQLLRAIQKGKVKAVKKLLAIADDTVKKSGKYLAISVFLEKPEIAKLLIESGADVTIKDHDGYPVLTRAANNGDVETVRAMIENGADVNSINSEGWTPLMGASYNGRLEVVKLLIEKGADINAKNKFGTTALAAAKGQEYPKITKYLVEKGSKPLSSKQTLAEKKGKATLPVQDEDLSISQMIAELVMIGRTDGFLSMEPGGKFDGNRRNSRARIIGELLNQRGGKPMMIQAGEAVQKELGSTRGRELEIAWHLIGQWKG